MAGTAIVAAAGIGGALISSNAQSDAADKASNTAAYGYNLQRKQWEKQQADMAPWLKAGTGAVNQLGALMQPGGQLYDTTFDMADYTADPSYNYIRQQAMDAIKAQGLAGGNYGSGNMASALQTQAANLASTDYTNAYNRWLNSQNTLYNRLAGVAGTGQTAVSELGKVGAYTGNSMVNTLMQGADANAAGQIGSANAWTNALSSMGNQAMKAYGAYKTYNQNMLGNATEPIYNSWDPYGIHTGGESGAGSWYEYNPYNPSIPT